MPKQGQHFREFFIKRLIFIFESSEFGKLQTTHTLFVGFAIYYISRNTTSHLLKVKTYFNALLITN
jgi:uncharacterized membrane protein YiaA